MSYWLSVPEDGKGGMSGNLCSLMHHESDAIEASRRVTQLPEGVAVTNMILGLLVLGFQHAMNCLDMCYAVAEVINTVPEQHRCSAVEAVSNFERT